MGLTNNSVGINAVDSGLEIKKLTQNDKVVAIAGNPIFFDALALFHNAYDN